MKMDISMKTIRNIFLQYCLLNILSEKRKLSEKIPVKKHCNNFHTQPILKTK